MLLLNNNDALVSISDNKLQLTLNGLIKNSF